ncbi:MAG: response regulator [Desulfobacterales bacterium]|nr:response regulator [Desulfobacterales bacterium]
MAKSFKHTRTALAFMAVLLVLLVILDSLIFFWERDVLFEESHNQTQNELELIGTFVTEPLLRQEFTIVEQFMNHWGELKEDVISLKAFSPDGSLFAEYKRPFKITESFTKNHTVEFFGQHLMDLEITKDLSPAIHHLRDFKQRLVFQSLLITIIIGILLWFVLEFLSIKPLETEIEKRMQAEKNLQMAHDRLEELVEARTRELREANIELHNEIYEKHKIQEELLKAKKLESVSVLAGGLAHDFNNILAAIMGNISLALLYTDHDDKRHKLLAEAEKASLRAKDLTQQLLTFSKGGEPVKTLASIEEVIRDSANFVLRGSNVQCKYHFTKDLWPVEVDSGQISQVIQNIVINARHAMPDGGIIDVTCENYDKTQKDRLLTQADSYLKITIQDSGVGMPLKLLDKIFDPYFSTKREGSGLGLAICHSIISKHNGYIKVESVQGEGASFIFYLPALKGQQPAEQLGEETFQVIGSGKALVMDDEEMIRDLAGKMLSYSGYHVTFAKNGEESIDFYKKEMETGIPFDFVILDLTIPGGMGGKEAIKKILQIDPKAKVIVSSGYSNDPVMANYKEYGFSGVIAKPFQLKNLQKAINSVFVDDQ